MTNTKMEGKKLWKLFGKNNFVNEIPRIAINGSIYQDHW